MYRIGTALAAITALFTLGACASAEDLASENAGSGSQTSDSSDQDSEGEPTDDGSESPDDSEKSEEPPEPKPEQPKPQVGDCYALKPKVIDYGVAATGQSPVKCAKSHTAQTIYVATAKGSLKKAMKASKMQRIYDQLKDKCANRLSGWTGGGKDRGGRTGYRAIIGIPQLRDIERGAFWVRCDIVLYKPNNNKPTKLPKDTRNSLTGTTSNVDYCLPGRNAKKYVLCSQPHNFRSIGQIRLGGPNASYPGQKKIDRRLNRRCIPMARGFLNGKNRYTVWKYPLLNEWQNGVRLGICFAKTKR